MAPGGRGEVFAICDLKDLLDCMSIATAETHLLQLSAHLVQFVGSVVDDDTAAMGGVWLLAIRRSLNVSPVDIILCRCIAESTTHVATQLIGSVYATCRSRQSRRQDA